MWVNSFVTLLSLAIGVLIIITTSNQQQAYNQTLSELKRIDRTGHFQRALPQIKQ